MRRKRQLVLPLSDEDSSDYTIIDVYIDQEEEEDLLDAGYLIVSATKLSYTVPSRYLGPFIFWCILFLQDLIRFKVFNTYRKVYYYSALRDVYNVELSEKNAKYLEEMLQSTPSTYEGVIDKLKKDEEDQEK